MKKKKERPSDNQRWSNQLDSQLQQAVSRPFIKHLPPEFTAPMGQVMIDWAFYEMRLQELVNAALNISVVQGRLAIKSMRASEMFELAADLFLLQGLEISVENLNHQQVLAARRNLLAHGVWMKDGDVYLLRDLTGTTATNSAKIKRKILPAGIPMTAVNIIDLSRAIQTATAGIESLIQNATKLRSSSRKVDPE